MTGNKKQAYIWFFAKWLNKKTSIYSWSQKFTYTFQNLLNVDYFTK